jgi:hypothetical protein
VFRKEDPWFDCLLHLGRFEELRISVTFRVPDSLSNLRPAMKSLRACIVNSLQRFSSSTRTNLEYLTLWQFLAVLKQHTRKYMLRKVLALIEEIRQECPSAIEFLMSVIINEKLIYHAGARTIGYAIDSGIVTRSDGYAALKTVDRQEALRVIDESIFPELTSLPAAAVSIRKMINNAMLKSRRDLTTTGKSIKVSERLPGVSVGALVGLGSIDFFLGSHGASWTMQGG